MRKRNEVQEKLYQEWKIVVEGEPVTLQRARFSPRRGTIYTPKRSINQEKKIHYTALNYGVRKIGKKETVRIEIGVYGKNVMMGDLDNYVKLVLDGLRKFFDDRRVVDLWAYKRKDEKPRTEIIIRYG